MIACWFESNSFVPLSIQDSSPLLSLSVFFFLFWLLLFLLSACGICPLSCAYFLCRVRLLWPLWMKLTVPMEVTFFFPKKIELAKSSSKSFSSHVKGSIGRQMSKGVGFWKTSSTHLPTFDISNFHQTGNKYVSLNWNISLGLCLLLYRHSQPKFPWIITMQILNQLSFLACCSNSRTYKLKPLMYP